MAQHRITVGEELRYDVDVKAVRGLNGTYVRGQVRNASGALDPTKQAIIVLDANGDIDDIQIAAVS